MHHRRCRRRCPSPGHGLSDDDAPRPRGASEIKGAQRRRFPPFHRPDASRHPHSNLCHRRSGCEQCWPLRGFPSGVAGRFPLAKALADYREALRQKIESSPSPKLDTPQ